VAHEGKHRRSEAEAGAVAYQGKPRSGERNASCGATRTHPGRGTGARGGGENCVAAFADFEKPSAHATDGRSHLRAGGRSPRAANFVDRTAARIGPNQRDRKSFRGKSSGQFPRVIPGGRWRCRRFAAVAGSIEESARGFIADAGRPGGAGRWSKFRDALLGESRRGRETLQCTRRACSEAGGAGTGRGAKSCPDGASGRDSDAGNHRRERTQRRRHGYSSRRKAVRSSASHAAPGGARYRRKSGRERRGRSGEQDPRRESLRDPVRRRA
jgi:hypothetical protein